MTSRLERHYKKGSNHDKAQLMKLLTESLTVSSKNHISPQYREPFQTLAETKNQLNLAKNIPSETGVSDGKSCIINQKGTLINKFYDIMKNLVYIPFYIS
jgi:hypothetical protein